MARSTMANLIADVRGLCYASTAEYTIGTASYWDDDQIQRVLDRHERDIWHFELTPVPQWVAGGTVQYVSYYMGNPDDPIPNWESTDGGTATFVVRNASGSPIATANYTPDYQAGLITFTTNQGGSVYYLDGRLYDIYGAAADLLTAWATREKFAFDFAEDGQQFKLSQKVTMMTQLADQYRAQMWVGSAETIRGDIDQTEPDYFGTGDAKHHARG